MDVNGGDGLSGDTPLDLTPRTGADGEAPRSARPDGPRRWVGVAVVVAVLVLGGFIVSQALGDAALFFRHADEAVAQRAELGTDDFRMHGLVVAGSVEEDPAMGVVRFEVSWNGVSVPVEHHGDPPELFRDDIPVVLEGHWADTGFDADFLSRRMLVKHDENYEEDHGDRIVEAVDGADSDASEPPRDAER